MSSSPSLPILIGPYEFHVRAAYTAGHVLSADEAKAFNEWRARGIVGNMRGRVKHEEECCRLAPGELLSDATLEALQKLIDEFDSRYAHPMERGSRNTKNTASRPRGAIEAEAIRIAARWLETENRRAGRKQHQEDFDAEVEAMAQDVFWRGAARQVIYSKAKIGRQNVE